MRTRFLILGFLAWIGGLPGSARQAGPPLDPTCGFISGPHEYHEAAEVKQGLSVELVVGQPQIGHPINLRFFVNEKPRNVPVGTLQVEHEKLMHVIGVRDDLEGFFHLHPLKVGPGAWEVVKTFDRAGNFKIWTDVKYRGVSYSFGQPLLPVTGKLDGIASNRRQERTQTRSGYTVNLKTADRLTVSQTNRLEFSIRDSGGVVEPENFLGTPMHLVIVKDDLSVFIHAHPEPRRPGSAITFSQSFPSAGAYKLFAQLRPKGGNLPPDDSVLVEFWVEVGRGNVDTLRR